MWTINCETIKIIQISASEANWTRPWKTVSSCIRGRPRSHLHNGWHQGCHFWLDPGWARPFLEGACVTQIKSTDHEKQLTYVVTHNIIWRSTLCRCDLCHTRILDISTQGISCVLFSSHYLPTISYAKPLKTWFIVKHQYDNNPSTPHHVLGTLRFDKKIYIMYNCWSYLWRLWTRKWSQMPDGKSVMKHTYQFKFPQSPMKSV